MKNEKNENSKLDDFVLEMRAGFKSVNELIENLATMTVRGFDDIYARMATKDDVDKIVAESEKRLSEKIEELDMKIYTRTTGMRRDLDYYSEWMRETDKRVNRLEDRVLVKKTK